MAKIEPPKPRSIITDSEGRLEIVIPVKTNWLIVLFLGGWLSFWVIGEGVGITMFLAADDGPPIGFIIVWLTGWTLGGVFALLMCSWQLFGRERIAVESASLIQRKELLRLGRTREYDLTLVKNLRVSPVTVGTIFDFTAGMQFWGLGGGLIAFDYGAKTFRLGSGIDEPEANKLVELISKRR